MGKKDPLGGPLGVPSSFGGRWGIGVGGVWNVNFSLSVGKGVVMSVVEGPATCVGLVYHVVEQEKYIRGCFVERIHVIDVGAHSHEFRHDCRENFSFHFI